MFPVYVLCHVCTLRIESLGESQKNMLKHLPIVRQLYGGKLEKTLDFGAGQEEKQLLKKLESVCE